MTKSKVDLAAGRRHLHTIQKPRAIKSFMIRLVSHETRVIPQADQAFFCLNSESTHVFQALGKSINNSISYKREPITRNMMSFDHQNRLKDDTANVVEKVKAFVFNEVKGPLGRFVLANFIDLFAASSI